jgi:hypothetical protein
MFKLQLSICIYVYIYVYMNSLSLALSRSLSLSLSLCIQIHILYIYIYIYIYIYNIGRVEQSAEAEAHGPGRLERWWSRQSGWRGDRPGIRSVGLFYLYSRSLLLIVNLQVTAPGYEMEMKHTQKDDGYFNWSLGLIGFHLRRPSKHEQV